MVPSLLDRYRALFTSLRSIIRESESRSLAADDAFFVDHANFLVKSFLICACSYLESYLKDIVTEHITYLTAKVASAGIPHNLVQWQVSKKEEWKFSDFTIAVADKSVDDMISANPYRTVNAMRCIGIDINGNTFFSENKTLVNAIVEKRNSIVHHNDLANDLSPGDILMQIEVLVRYIEEIDATVIACR